MGEKSEASAESGVADASASETADEEAVGESEERTDPPTDGTGTEENGELESEAGDADASADEGNVASADDRADDAPGEDAPAGGRVPEEFGSGDGPGSGTSRRGIPPSGRPGEPDDDGSAEAESGDGDAADPELVASEFVAPNPDAANVAASTATRLDGERAAPYDRPKNVRDLVGDSFSPPEAVSEDPDVRDPYEEIDADGDVDDIYRDDITYDEHEDGIAGMESGEFAEPDGEFSEPDGELTDDEFADGEFDAEGADGAGYADVDDGLLSEGPESDQEMPLADHIEEMVNRLGIVFAIGIVATILAFPMADQLINTLWNTHIPGAPMDPDRRPRLYGPLELILTELKVAGLAGFILGLPVFVYQTYRFMRPGLYPRERRYYLAAVPTSLVLALIGVAFSHFIVLPAIFAYFTSYTEGTAVVAFGLKETFRLILLLMGYMALVFQIPLFIMLAIMMNLVTRQWLTEKRLLFWGSFAGISFLISPDPTGMAPIIVAATMIALFEGTLALLRWTGN